MQLLAILVAISLLGGALYMLWRPHWAILAILLMFPFEQLLHAYVPSLLLTMGPLVNFTVGGVALSAVISQFMGRESATVGLWNGTTISLLVLYVLTYLSVLYSPGAPYVSSRLGLAIPQVLLMMIGGAVLAPRLDRLPAVFAAFMVIGTLLTLLILANPSATFMSGRLTLEFEMTGGQRGNPLAIADMGGTIAIVAALLRFRRASTLMLAIRIAAFISGLGIALTSGSRGQVAATIVAVVLFFPVSRQTKNARQFILTALGLIAVLGIIYLTVDLFITDQNAARWSAEGAQEGIRDRFNRVALLLGAYLGSPGSWIQGLGINAFSEIWGEGSYVHNLVAEILAEQGLIGFTCLILAVRYAYRHGRRLWVAHASDPILRSAIATLLAVCAFQFLLSLKQGAFWGMPTFFMFLIMLARIGCRESILAAEQETRRQYLSFWDPAVSTAYLEDDETGESLPATA